MAIAGLSWDTGCDPWANMSGVSGACRGPGCVNVPILATEPVGEGTFWRTQAHPPADCNCTSEQLVRDTMQLSPVNPDL